MIILCIGFWSILYLLLFKEKHFRISVTCNYWNISGSNTLNCESWSFWKLSPVVGNTLLPRADWTRAFESETNNLIKSSDGWFFHISFINVSNRVIWHGLCTHILFGYLICCHNDILKVEKIALAFGPWIMIWLSWSFSGLFNWPNVSFVLFCNFLNPKHWE